MINLLSPDSKHEFRAAKLNVVLFRYCIVLGLGLVFLSGIFGVGFYLANNEKTAIESEKQQFAAQTAQYTKTKQEAEEFAKNLNTGKKMLDSEIVFSKLVTDIAAIIPSGAVLDNLSLSTATINNSFTLNAHASSSDKVIELKNKLESSPLFENVGIKTITEQSTEGLSGNAAKYPFAATLDAKLVKTTNGAQR